MATYQLHSAAASSGHVPKHPERTASHPGRAWDSADVWRDWTTREAMARAIRRHERDCSGMLGCSEHWRAYQPLALTEGY